MELDIGATLQWRRQCLAKKVKQRESRGSASDLNETFRN